MSLLSPLSHLQASKQASWEGQSSEPSSSPPPDITQRRKNKNVRQAEA